MAQQFGKFVGFDRWSVAAALLLKDGVEILGAGLAVGRGKKAFSIHYKYMQL